LEIHRVINRQRDYYLEALGIVQYIFRSNDLNVSDERFARGSNLASRDIAAMPSVVPESSIAPLQRANEGSKLSVENGFEELAPQSAEVGAPISTVESALEVKFALWQPAPEILLVSDIGPALPDWQRLELL
jgi:hypothetical protein